MTVRNANDGDAKTIGWIEGLRDDGERTFALWAIPDRGANRQATTDDLAAAGYVPKNEHIRSLTTARDAWAREAEEQRHAQEAELTEQQAEHERVVTELRQLLGMLKDEQVAAVEHSGQLMIERDAERALAEEARSIAKENAADYLQSTELLTSQLAAANARAEEAERRAEGIHEELMENRRATVERDDALTTELAAANARTEETEARQLQVGRCPRCNSDRRDTRKLVYGGGCVDLWHTASTEQPSSPDEWVEVEGGKRIDWNDLEFYPMTEAFQPSPSPTTAEARVHMTREEADEAMGEYVESHPIGSPQASTGNPHSGSPFASAFTPEELATIQSSLIPQAEQAGCGEPCPVLGPSCADCVARFSPDDHPAVCRDCGLLRSDEPSVRRRTDGMPRCNDCDGKRLGQKPIQTSPVPQVAQASGECECLDGWKRLNPGSHNPRCPLHPSAAEGYYDQPKPPEPLTAEVLQAKLIAALRQVEEANPKRWFDSLADRLEGK